MTVIDVGHIADVRALADNLGVSRQTIYHWLATEPDFPRPVRHLRCGRIWDRSEVDGWHEARRRGGAR